MFLGGITFNFIKCKILLIKFLVLLAFLVAFSSNNLAHKQVFRRVKSELFFLFNNKKYYMKVIRKTGETSGG